MAEISYPIIMLIQGVSVAIIGGLFALLEYRRKTDAEKARRELYTFINRVASEQLAAG